MGLNKFSRFFTFLFEGLHFKLPKFSLFENDFHAEF